MKQIKLFDRSVGDALDIIRYLDSNKLVEPSKVAQLREKALDLDGFILGDFAISYWRACSRAHALGEITDDQILSIIDFGEDSDANTQRH